MRNIKLTATVWVAALIAALSASSSLSAAPPDYPFSGSGRQASTVKVERWVEEWDPRTRQWKRVNSADIEIAPPARGKSFGQQRQGQPRFGPFVVQNAKVAALIARTDRYSINHFDQMLANFPDIELLTFIDAPGTIDDVANLQLGRQIRASGLSTTVPSYGSARSGAVELFLAGVRRSVEPGARFAVHSWRDNFGRGPRDLPESHPYNQLYIDYYTEMGMSLRRARAFYAMTNAVPFENALWFGARDMQQWLLPSQNR